MVGAKRIQAGPSADISGHRPPAFGPNVFGGSTFFRSRDAAKRGITSRGLRRLLDRGTVERVARGLYRFCEVEATEHHTEAAVCARLPAAVVCLLSALRIHDLGAQSPWQVWIGIPHRSRTPRVTGLPIRVVRFSGASLRHGVETTTIEGVPVRITNPARTVVDCFRFRRTVGKDVAYEALREALFDRKATPAEIWRAAEVCRARTLIRPVLEAFSI